MAVFIRREVVAKIGIGRRRQVEPTLKTSVLYYWTSNIVSVTSRFYCQPQRLIFGCNVATAKWTKRRGLVLSIKSDYHTNRMLRVGWFKLHELRNDDLILEWVLPVFEHAGKGKFSLTKSYERFVLKKTLLYIFHEFFSVHCSILFLTCVIFYTVKLKHCNKSNNYF